MAFTSFIQISRTVTEYIGMTTNTDTVTDEHSRLFTPRSAEVSFYNGQVEHVKLHGYLHDRDGAMTGYQKTVRYNRSQIEAESVPDLVVGLINFARA